MERRKFTREFKLEAVRLIRDRGVSYAQAAQDLAVHQSQLRSCENDAQFEHWSRKATPAGLEPATPSLEGEGCSSIFRAHSDNSRFVPLLRPLGNFPVSECSPVVLLA